MLKNGGLNSKKSYMLILLIFPLLQLINLIFISDDFLRKFISDFLQAGSAVYSSLLLFRSVQLLRGSGRRNFAGWNLVFISSLFYSGGMLLFMYYEIFLGVPPYPGLPDVSFSIFYPLLIWGITILPKEKLDRREKIIAAIDMMAFVMVAVLVIWQFNLRFVLKSLNESPNAGVWMSLGYTILDSALLFVLFYRFTQKLVNEGSFLPTLMLIIGGFFQITGDLMQGYISTLGLFESGSPADLGWVLFSTFTGLAALELIKKPAESGEGHADVHERYIPNSLWSLAITYLWIAIVFFVLIWTFVRREETNPGLLIAGALGAVLLASTRQIITLRDNSTLVRALRNSQAVLEKKVEERTALLKQQADRLRVSEKKFREMSEYIEYIINTIPASIVLIDHQGIINHYNAGAQKYFQGDAGGRNNEFFDSFPSFRFVKGLLDKSVSQSASASDTFVISGEEGELRHYQASVFPLRGENESGSVIMIEDVTERKNIEQLMIQNEKVAGLAGLAAGMAHEINNPLGTIVQGCQNILRRIDRDFPKNVAAAARIGLDLRMLDEYMKEREIHQILGSMRNAAAKAGEIVKNMLQYSRRSESKKINYRIDRLIDETIELANNDYQLKKKFDFRSIKVIREYGEGLPEIWMTVTEIQQVLFNIIQNAAHALRQENSRAKVPTIIIRTLLNCDYIKIEIEDNGPGIDEKTMSRIFEPFFTTKEVGEGTGLGLSVSYMIVTKNHNGLIEVRSAKNAGTTFTIKLPLEKAGVS